MHSHAVVFTGPNEVAYQAITSPEPGPGEVVVEVHHSWISNGTEGSFLRGERLSGDEAWRPGDPAPFPMVAGYQKVGRVLQVGATVTDLAVGDWVFASMSRVCGMFDNRFAGHVSPGVCERGAVLKLQPGADPLAYAGLVLAQVGYNCGMRPAVAPGEVAVVVGDGLVGQWAGQTLAQRGARVVMVGRHEDRLARFRRFGATVAGGDDFGFAAVQALGLGPVQVVVETVGQVAALHTYRPVMARGGQMVIAGFYRPSGEVNLQTSLQEFRNHELTFHLVSGATPARLAATMEWIAAGRLETLGLLTHRFPVERAAEAWTLIESKRDPVLGVVLDWPAARGAAERHTQGETFTRSAPPAPATMKSLQIVAPGRAEWKDYPVPAPGPGEVLVCVRAVATCPHWDMHIFGGRPMFAGMNLEYPYLPGAPGHEAAGEVAALGPGVTKLRVGARVAAWRDTGKPRPGFYAQFNTFPEDDLLELPPSLDFAALASLELAMCVEVSFQQLAALGGIAGRRIGLSGLGPAGLVAVQLARAHGAAEVIGFDPLPERRALAEQLGAHRTLAPDAAAWPASRTTEALDDAIDLTGVPASIEFLMDRTRRAVALFGVLREEVRFTSQHLFGPGLMLLGYGDHNRIAAETARRFLAEGKLTLTPLCSATLPLTRYAEAVEQLRRKEAIKVLFDPWAEPGDR
jgi:3-hydroxyethyl bacteriochlorophyllide a dehydrogenase